MIHEVILTIPSSGPGLVLAPHGMTAQPPYPIGHVRGALRDDLRLGGETRDDHLQEEAMKDNCRLGDLMGDYHHQGGWTADDRHQGGTVRADHPQEGHPLSKKSQAVQEDWFRNYWKHHQV